VFIASVHRNNEAVLRGGWNQALLSIIDYLGADNVFVSVVEGGSQDKTKAALRELKQELDERGVPNKVKLGMTVWQQIEEIDARPSAEAPHKEGWIWWDAEKRYDLRRIPYLSRVRNQALEPLAALALEELDKDGAAKKTKKKQVFDQVLWLNDVVFDTQDLVTLLRTNGGEYAAACSMDFKSPPFYYDTFALRDDKGYKTTTQYWPWFQSGRARRALWRSEPIKVKSCWNGIVAFDATPFYSGTSSSSSISSSSAQQPLRFRGIPDSLADLHLEGSECCLVHADNHLSAVKGVWLNPNVRVGYSADAYRQVRTDVFPTAYESITGTWLNRLLHFRMRLQEGLESSTVHKRIRQWQKTTPAGEPKRYEPGDFCLINEMQIMYQNGWKHI
ncbi:cryptococcal mannosyltransferase 1-domain-containing protein, partial [Microdochium trichocladiopsis]